MKHVKGPWCQGVHSAGLYVKAEPGTKLYWWLNKLHYFLNLVSAKFNDSF